MMRRQGLTAIDAVMALVSGVIFACCAGLHAFVVRIDAESRK